MPSKDYIIADLIKKNKELELKLLSASEWMSKNIAEKKDVIDGNIEEINVNDIKKSIKNFLWDYPLGPDESNIIDDLFSSELLFVHGERDNSIDGTAIIIGYNKVLDFTIEKYITSPFRKFAHARCKNILISSSHIEANLHSTIHKGFMMSIGRLFEILENIKYHYKKEFYLTLFEDFLQEHTDISDAILSDNFFLPLKTLVDKEIFGSKRHSGSVSFADAQEARKIIMGDYKDANCLCIKLLKLGQTF